MLLRGALINRSKNIAGLIFVLTAVFLSSSCQLVERIRTPRKIEKEIVEKTYQRDAVGFSHPDDWVVTGDEVSEKNFRTIVIVDYYTSVVRIRLFPLETEINLRNYVEKTGKNQQKDIPFVEASEGEIGDTAREFQGKRYNGIQLKRLFSFQGVNVPHTTDFFLAQNRKYKVLISIEAFDEEWKAADKEFQLILDSLKFE